MSKNKSFKSLKDLKNSKKIDKKSTTENNQTNQMDQSVQNINPNESNLDLNKNQVPNSNAINAPKQIEDSSKQNVIKDLENKIDTLEAKLDIAQAESKDWQKKAFRYVADLENSQKQQVLEVAQIRKNTKKILANPLVEFLNNQYLALVFSKETTDENAKKSLSTIDISFKKLILDLQNQGIQVLVPSIGDKFDPETMQSLNELSNDNVEAKIKHIVSIGLRVDEQVIQPVMVMI